MAVVPLNSVSQVAMSSVLSNSMSTFAWLVSRQVVLWKVLLLEVTLQDLVLVEAVL